MKFAYFGYDFFAGCLEELLLQGHELVKLFTHESDNERYDFNLRVTQLAKERGVPMQLNPPNASDISQLESLKCDWLIAAAYPFKIPVSPIVRGINIHPTLLPEGRGPWPLPWVILNQSEISGITIHELGHDWDSGPIVLQQSFRVSQDENLESLSLKSQILAHSMIRELFFDVEKHWRTREPQSSGSYWRFPTDYDRTLRWDAPVEEIERVARAFGKFASYAKFDDTQWIVQDVHVWQEQHHHEVGSVVHRSSKELVIAARDGFVCLRYYEIDPDFVRG